MSIPKFWTSFLEGASPCPFPAAMNGAGGQSSVQHLVHTVPCAETSGPNIRTAILVAWVHVLSAHSGSKDVTFGAILRDNVLPFRSSLNRGLDQAGDQFMLETSILIEDMQRHSDVLSREDIVILNESIGFLHSVIDVHRFQMTGSQKVPCDVSYNTAIRITCDVIGQNLSLSAAFDVKFVKAPRALYLLYELGHVVTQLLSPSPKWVIGDIEVVSPQEKVQMISWNDRGVYPQLSCVHETIASWAGTQPTAQALCSWDGSFTYAELDSFSSQLATYLLKQGIKPNNLVPFCVERSALAVIIMIAIMKTGGAFVPLEPSVPLNRNLEIVRQSGAAITLVSQPQIAKWQHQPIIAISWDLLVALPRAQPASGGLPIVNLLSLAYVIFTSGSTGSPKGVMIEHRSLSLSLRSQGEGYIFGQGTSTRALQFASLAFDASLAEHLGPLSNGGCVCIPDQETRLENLVGFMNQTRVNWAFFTPSFFRLLDPEDLPLLRTVVLGGEAITDDCIDRWAHRIRLINGYGPSEATICATACVVDPKSPHRTSIGTGMVCKTWVVDIDNSERLAPLGTVGELLLQGPTVGRGYLNDEVKTKAAFITPIRWLKGHPEDAGNMYRTGDLVRLQSDGSLTYVGRRDMQVKIRGHRVELPEIEKQIAVHAPGQNVVVLFPGTGPAKGRLTAILEFEEEDKDRLLNGTILELVSQSIRRDAASKMDQISSQLSMTLPDYMIPTVWIPVRSIPLSTAGKIARSVLLRWLETGAELSFLQPAESRQLAPETMPTSGFEKVLQRIWAAVLNVAPSSLPVNASFLRLGGDSLTAVRVVACCRRENISIKVSNLLQGQTIAQLAKAANYVPSSVVQHEDHGPFPLSAIQTLYVLHAPTESHYFNQSLLLRILGKSAPDDIVHALRAVVREHPMLRVSLCKDLDGWKQCVLPSEEDHFTVAIHSGARVPERQIMDAGQEKTNAFLGPVFHAEMFYKHDALHLFLVAHHIAIDLISWDVILSDLDHFLSRGAVKHTVSTPYKTWCSHIQTAQSPKLCPPCISTVNPAFWGMKGKKNLYGDIRHYKATLDGTHTQSLHQWADRADGRRLDLLLAGLLICFNRIFGRIPVIHNESHGRHFEHSDLDVSNTVGWFTTLMPIAVHFDSNTTLPEVCRRVQFARTIHDGLGHFSSSILGQVSAPTYEIVFNYMGSTDWGERGNYSSLEPIAGSMGVSGDSASNNMPRFALIEVSAQQIDGQIEFTFSANRLMNRLDDIQRWASMYVDLLTTAVLDLRTQIHVPCPSPLLGDNYDEAAETEQNVHQLLGLDYTQVQSIYPASPVQNSMLLAQANNLRNYQATLVMDIRARGSVDQSRLIRAWSTLVERHDILRTVFVPRTDDTYVQVVLREFNPGVRVVGDNEDSSFEDSIVSSVTLAQPNHRLSLRQHAGTIQAILDISHTLIDHITFNLLLRELCIMYSGCTADLPSALVAPYRQFIIHLAQQDPVRSIEYWRSLLPTPLRKQPHPFHPASKRVVPGSRLLYIPVHLSLSTQRDLTITGYTPSTVIRLCWALTLARHRGDMCACFGYVVSGRDPGTAVHSGENIIGPCLSILPCIVNLRAYAADKPETTSNLLSDIQSQYVAGLAHQHHFLTYASQVRRENALDVSSTRVFFDTLINFRRHESTPTIGNLDIAFQVAEEHDPFDYDIVVEVDHSEKDKFLVRLAFWEGSEVQLAIRSIASMFENIIPEVVCQLR